MSEKETNTEGAADDELDRLESKFDSDPNPELIDELFGEGGTLNGNKLRPITLASIALLERSDNALISGQPLIHTPEIVLECCKFIALQRGTLKEARALALDRNKLDEAAFEIADAIAPNKAEATMNEITSMLAEATDTQVIPVVEEADRQVGEGDEPGNAGGHPGESD